MRVYCRAVAPSVSKKWGRRKITASPAYIFEYRRRVGILFRNARRRLRFGRIRPSRTKATRPCTVKIGRAKERRAYNRRKRKTGGRANVNGRIRLYRWNVIDRKTRPCVCIHKYVYIYARLVCRGERRWKLLGERRITRRHGRSKKITPVFVQTSFV